MAKGNNKGSKFWASLALIALLFSYYVYIPDYKKSDWILDTAWPVQELGQSKADHIKDEIAYVIEFPFKMIRSVVILQLFKFHYIFFADAQKYIGEERYGGFFLHVGPNKPPEDMIKPIEDIKRYFDADNDGDGDAVTWVNDRAAVLFLDKNKNGKLDDGGELLLPSNYTHWTALQALDDNDDGVIDGKDHDFRNMVLWWDRNNDQIQDTGEHSYASDYFVQIDVSKIRPYQGGSQNEKSSRSLEKEAQILSYVKAVARKTGTKVRIYFMLFGEHLTNNGASLMNYLSYHDMTVGDAEKIMNDLEAYPNLRGYGDTPDLHVRIYEDAVLQQDIEKLMQLLADEFLLDVPSYDAYFENVLYRWADVHDIAPDSRGWFVDGRKMAYMEKLMGNDFYQLNYYHHPMPFAAQMLKDTFWVTAYNRHRAALIMQSPVGYKMLNGSHRYDHSNEVYETTGLSRKYLMELATKARDISPEKRRALLELIGHVTDIILEDKNIPPAYRKSALRVKAYKKYQIETLQLFASSLF